MAKGKKNTLSGWYNSLGWLAKVLITIFTFTVVTSIVRVMSRNIIGRLIGVLVLVSLICGIVGFALLGALAGFIGAIACFFYVVDIICAVLKIKLLFA